MKAFRIQGQPGNSKKKKFRTWENTQPFKRVLIMEPFFFVFLVIFILPSFIISPSSLRSANYHCNGLGLSESQSFWSFWNTFVNPNSPNILTKSVPKLFDLVNPPPLSTKKSKHFGLQKVSQIFGLLLTPPHPSLWTKSKLKLHFFWERP